MITRFTHGLAAVPIVIAVAGSTPARANDDRFELVSTIAFSSTRDGNLEIYLINPDGTNPRRLTDNTDGDALAALSPDGKKVVFDSNRNRAEAEPVNTSDLFVMNTDGSEQTFLTRGSSATWSPDSKNVAFHASASGSGTPLRTDPGSATSDSDIFIGNVDDISGGLAQTTNITNSPDKIDDDPSWSPDGQTIVYTAHNVGDDPPAPPFLSNTAEIYLRNADGTGAPQQLTFNDYEERGPDFSPDGTRIEFMCRIGGGSADFEICLMNTDGSGLTQLTDNSIQDLSANWSPDGHKLVFHRGPLNELFVMNADGSDVTQITNTVGLNLLASWGELRVHVTP
jgi:TolB protein